MSMTKLERLTLTNFRNFERLVWTVPSQKIVAYGPNASGKTNLLESLSLLVPGRGLRKARIEDLANNNNQTQGWGIVGEFSNQQYDSNFTLSTGCFPFSSKRQYRINGNIIQNQNEITRYLAAVWLTPQMDRLFLEGPSGRRRFLDQLIISLEGYYAKELAAYEKSLFQRNKLLSANMLDHNWLKAVEESMARHAVAITAARINFIQQLNQINIIQKAFPETLLKLNCSIADYLMNHPALVTEDYLKQKWKMNRDQDAENRSTALGCHRMDVVFFENKSNISAQMASTGQQKAILISVILKLLELIKTNKKIQPLLLLDEPLTHLDSYHRKILLSSLLDIDSFVIITGNEISDFYDFEKNYDFLNLNHGKIV